VLVRAAAVGGHAAPAASTRLCSDTNDVAVDAADDA
jgi:hypothetical protein